jgi:hypothetical protein
MFKGRRWVAGAMVLGMMLIPLSSFPMREKNDLPRGLHQLAGLSVLRMSLG